MTRGRTAFAVARGCQTGAPVEIETRELHLISASLLERSGLMELSYVAMKIQASLKLGIMCRNVSAAPFQQDTNRDRWHI